ncbi:unnamed protein product, partial [Brassica oleracea var. botrytis]
GRNLGSLQKHHLAQWDHPQARQRIGETDRTHSAYCCYRNSKHPKKRWGLQHKNRLL